MITTILFSFLIFALAVTGLSIGIIVKGKPIKGHCGGGDHCSCESSEPVQQCQLEEPQRPKAMG